MTARPMTLQKFSTSTRKNFPTSKSSAAKIAAAVPSAPASSTRHGLQPQGNSPRPLPPRLWPILHGHQPSLHDRQRPFPHDPPALSAWGSSDVVGVFQSLAKTRASLQRSRLSPFSAALSVG